MTIRHLQHAPTSRANIEQALRHAQPHLRPIFAAVRDNHAGLLFIGQSREPFDLPNDPKRPAIILIGDDFDKAVGPDGFDLPSLRRAIASACAAAVVASGPIPEPYAAVTVSAVLHRRNVILIETRPEFEIQWANLCREVSPDCPLLISTVKGGRA